MKNNPLNSAGGPSNSRLRVCHVIGGTGVGGAQTMLQKLVERVDSTEFETRVISLSGCGTVGEEMQASGVRVDALHAFRDGPPRPWRFVTLLRKLRAYRPHVIQTWMYYSDIVGGLAAELVGAPVVWNIRHSTLEPRTDSLRVRLAARCAGALSRDLPHKVLLNSKTAWAAHTLTGYTAERMEVLPNGFDLTKFKPSDEARRRVRAELKLDETKKLVGIVGRYHPHKDLRTFVVAAAHVARCNDDAHFVLCGKGLEWQNAELAEIIRRSNVADRFHPLGQRRDVPALQASFDVAVSSSVSEGFANAIGEAMACGVPCVVTDVGDSARIVGGTGRVVAPNRPIDMAKAILELLEMRQPERKAMGVAARQRIDDHFEIGAIVNRYCQVWRQAAGIPFRTSMGIESAA
jgi:glycosyltransferase involved in cell wall biosynthesis